MADPVGTTQPIGGTLDGPPKPPAGYQLQPKPPAGYSLDSMTPAPQDTVNEGEPYWVSSAIGRPTAVESAPSAGNINTANTREVAYVNPEDHPISKVNVVDKELFTPSVAAHETTHNFQYSRNADFQRNLDSLDQPNTGATALSRYDYGGVEGLKKNHPEIGKLNREQQGKIVQDLSDAQGSLHPHMTPAELAKWDETKHALERPIQQLQHIPAQENTVATAPDQWLSKHTIFNGHPLQRALDFISPPRPDTRPLGAAEPPSTALGYAQPSEYVRGGEYVQPETPSQKMTSQMPRATMGGYDQGPLSGKQVSGMLQQGNIDVNHRPGISNADGTHSSIFSMTVPVDKNGEVWKGAYDKAPGYALVPSIANGKFLTPDGKKPNEKDKKAMSQLEDAATDYYSKTKQHLGVFASSQAADKYAGQTHAYMNDGTAKKVYTPSY